MKDKKEKHINSREHRGIGKKILLFSLLFIFLAVLVAGAFFYFKYGKAILEYRSEAISIASQVDRETFTGRRTSICFYSDGSVMQELSMGEASYYLPYSAIPQTAVNTMLAIEDRKFFSHKGYDIYAIGRAAKAYFEHDGEIKQGGSTITQQLARLMFLSNEKTLKRKITEIFLAAELEKKFSKQDILEFYFNNIYFANGYNGLQAAALGYFGKNAGELSLSETAYICGIPNSPTAYNPRLYPEKTLERRNSVLLQMYENHYISEEEYRDALQEEIVLVTPKREMNNYEETYTYYCAVRALMKAEGFSIRTVFSDDEDREMYETAYSEEYERLKGLLYTKGYRIYTSINKEKQQLLQDVINDELSGFTETNDEGVFLLQAAGFCIDNETGLAVAVIGGRNPDYGTYTLNRAYQSPRQPGSSIKPLIVYTPAFERGYYPDSIVVDEKFEGGPRNSSGVYSGEIEIRQAVSVSKNTVAWKMFEELGIDTGLSYLHAMNFKSIVNSDRVPAAALGGLTYGATAEEMTAAYATIQNDGIYREPSCIKYIADAYGNVITDSPTSYKVYDKNASRMMVDVMKTVMTTGTGRKLALDGMTAAGKTGTTNDQKDGWFIGFTAYYTTGIWVGYDYPREMEDLRGNTYPGYIWKSYMNKIHEKLEDRGFEDFVDLRPKPENDRINSDSEEIITEDTETGSEDSEKTSEGGGTTSEGDENYSGDGGTTSEGDENYSEDGEDVPDNEADNLQNPWVKPGEEGDDGVIWVKPNQEEEDIWQQDTGEDVEEGQESTESRKAVQP